MWAGWLASIVEHVLLPFEALTGEEIVIEECTGHTVMNTVRCVAAEVAEGMATDTPGG